MAIDKIFKSSNVDDLADNILSEVDDFMVSVDKMQQRKVAGNVQKVIQAFKQIETDLQDRYDNVTDVLEKRVSTIKDGRDGLNGTDGRSGRDGKPGRDGVNGKQGPPGTPGKDGIDGVNGVSVTNANIDFDGSLVISLSTGEQINVGEVVPPELERQLVEFRQGGGSAGSSGDVMGPTASTDNAIVRFDGTDGKLVQNSVVTIADTTGNMTGVGTLTTTGDATIQGLTVGLGAGAVATNTAVGASAFAANVSGANNTAVGNNALADSTGSNNNALGRNALATNSSGSQNVAVGGGALFTNLTSSNSTAIGHNAGNVSTGAGNQFFGYNSGNAVTTGAKNVILGSYTGSAAPISATGSNFVVLSDGDGNVRATINSSNNLLVGTTTATATSKILASGAAGAAASQVDIRLIDTTSSNYVQIMRTGATYSYAGIAGNEAALYSTNSLNLVADGASSIKFSTNTTERMRIDSSGNVGIGTNAPTESLTVVGNAAISGTGYVSLERNVTPTAAGTGSPALQFRLVTTGTTYVAGSAIDMLSDGAWSATSAPGIIRFRTTPASSTTLVDRMRIDSAGNVLVTSTGGLGYGTGSGGAVTQATSRTTGVTLNKTNGAITLVSAAGLATFQSFTVTNSTVAATDVVHVTQKSGTDLYQIFVTATAAGSFRISYATTGGTTTEQPVFNFAVIKAVTV